MPDYQNGKIYKIHSYKTDLVYYGSTTQTLCRRFSKHKTTMKMGRGISSKSILEFNDAMITLVELFPCNSKSELLVRERFYIENNHCVNKDIPGRTRQQYYQQHKEKIQQYQQQNKEKISENKKQYQQQNKEKISKYKAQYHQQNKEKICNHNKQRREANQEYRKQFDYWRQTSPIGILARSYF